VLDAGHHGPALTERVEDRCEAIAGDESLGGFADGGAACSALVTTLSTSSQ
jgi:hypothetical protein